MSKDIEIKKLTLNHISEIMKIANQAKALLKQNGSLQWQQGYPNEETFATDIQNNRLYGLFEEGKLAGIAAFVYGIDQNYVEIDGKWEIPANEKDMSIHRVAVGDKYHGKKYGQKLLEHGLKVAKESGCVTVKVDTHIKNIPMQKSIEKAGFVYRGVVKILRDKEDNLRNAYEYIL